MCVTGVQLQRKESDSPKRRKDFIWLNKREARGEEGEKLRALTGSHTLCNTYFTPVEQQHVLPTITSMNHCLPSGDGAQGGSRGMTESKNDERNV